MTGFAWNPGRMLRLGAFGACALAAAPLAQAIGFDDPLSTPARISAIAAKSRLQSVAAAGSRLVAVGGRGHVLLSDDAGQHWRQVAVPVSSDLVQVRFVGDRAGWITGHDGVVLHTTDGGGTWQKVLDGVEAAALVGRSYAAAAVPESLRAEAQRFAAEGGDKPFFDIAFVNEREGFIAGAFGLLLATQDGGKTWQPWLDRIDNPKGRHLYAMAWSGEDLLVVGEQGFMARWRPGLDRMEPIAAPYGGSLFGVQARGSNWLIHGMQGNAYRSADAGRTWQRIRIGTSASLVASLALADGGFLLAAQDGSAWKVPVGESVAQRLPLRTPGVAFGMAVAPGGVLVIAGPSGVRVDDALQGAR